MMSLDDVIKAMENCYGPDAECCDKCQYTREVAGTGTICLKCNLEDDALHYLKEYRDMLEHPAKMIEWLRKNAEKKER